MILKGITLTKQRTTKGYQSSHDLRYQTRRWKKDRALHLQANPLCNICMELDNKVEPATVSDHIIPVNQGGDMWDWNNRQGLCKRHNAIKTALDNPNNQ
jgi:5-methylcytosine-specific restriction protein A